MFDGPGRVAVHAQAVHRRGQHLAAARDQAAGLQHASHVGDDGVAAVQHGAGLAPGHQHAGIGVGPVGIGLASHLQPGAAPGALQRRQGRGQQDQVAVDGAHRARDDIGQRVVLAGLVAERAVRLDVHEPGALGRGDASQGAHLVDDGGLKLGRRHLHRPAAEALQVRVGRVRARAHARGHGGADGAAHDQRVPRMEAAGDVGRPHHLQQGLVVAHGPGAEGFAEIGVQIDLHVRILRGFAW